jgi:hypothetical protein
MSNNNITDLITDQEIAFALLVLSGTMTDSRAAEVVGLNPDTAADIQSRPGVRDFIFKHRAATQQQLVEHGPEELRPFSVGRDRVLARLWDIANMEPEKTRNSMAAQVKAISMIVAIEGLIPARSPVSAQNEPATPPVHPGFYKSEWLRIQENGENADPHPIPAAHQLEAQEEAAPELQSAPCRADEATPSSPDPTPNPGESSFFGDPVKHLPSTSSVPRVPTADYFAPDTRVPFSIDKNRFGRRR